MCVVSKSCPDLQIGVEFEQKDLDTSGIKMQPRVLFDQLHRSLYGPGFFVGLLCARFAIWSRPSNRATSSRSPSKFASLSLRTMHAEVPSPDH
jgi:hypothetical protein